MNSAAPRALHNTGAGIESVDVFMEKVQVKAQVDSQLHMAFSDTNSGLSVRADCGYS